MGVGSSRGVWGSILDKHTVDEVATKRGSSWSLVKIPSAATIEQALAVLSEHRILSAPVFDEAFNTDLGFVDMLDIVRRCPQTA
jgi:CBS domain-containing protein